MRISQLTDLLWTPRPKPVAFLRMSASISDVVGAVQPIYGGAREADT